MFFPAEAVGISAVGLGVPEMSASGTSPEQSVGPCTFLEEGGAFQPPWTPFLPPARAEFPWKERRTDPGGGGEKKAGFPGNRAPRRSLQQLRVTPGQGMC